MNIIKTFKKIIRTFKKRIKTFKKWVDKIINHKYLDYQQIKPGVSVNYDARPEKRRPENPRTLNPAKRNGIILRKVKIGWLAANQSKQKFIVDENNFLSWGEFTASEFFKVKK
tara:strand:- start:96 stop:434 length:339 start_codon:yes stop_codon:yes gene_type:complete